MRRTPPEGFSVRCAREADLPGLAGLLGEPEAYAILDLCRAAGTLWAGADAEGAPVGVAAATEIDGTLHLAALAVIPSQWGKGLGSALLEAVLDHGRWAFHPAVTAAAAPDGARFLAGRGFLTLRGDALPPGLRAAVEADPPGRVAMARRL